MGRKTITILLSAFSLGATGAARMNFTLLGGIQLNAALLGLFGKSKVVGNAPKNNKQVSNFVKKARALSDQQSEDLSARKKKISDAAGIVPRTGPQIDRHQLFDALDILGQPINRADRTTVNDPVIQTLANNAKTAIYRDPADRNTYRTGQAETHLETIRTTINTELQTDASMSLNQRKARHIQLEAFQNELKNIPEDGHICVDVSSLSTEPVQLSGDTEDDSTERFQLISMIIANSQRIAYDAFLGELLGVTPTNITDDHRIEAHELAGKSAVDLLSKKLDGDYEIETAGPLQSLDISAFLIMLYPINDMFKIGVAANVGYSFKELNIKDTSIKMNESLTGSIGLAIGITEFFQIHAGLGVTRREIGFKTDSEYESNHNSVKKLFSNINTINYLKLASSQSPNADDTSSHIAIWGFGKVVITVPLSENWAALLHCGYQFDLNKFEVTDLGGFGPLKIEGVSHFNFGCAIAYKIM